MEYKSSHYNHFIDVSEDEFLLFNARTLATVELDREAYEAICHLLAMPHREDFPHLKEQLIAGEFLVPVTFDEKKVISERLWQARRNKNYLSLTIAPTIGCNFNCAYCFESEQARSNYTMMPTEIQDKLIAFVAHHISTYGVKKIEVCWFGGEPLLALQAIKRLSDAFLSLCSEQNIQYSASIITNGYRLDSKTAKLLRQLKIRSAQVTIDGPACIHDNRRILKGGAGSFKRIVKNLRPASQEIDILIRVNVDKQNANYLEQMLFEINEIAGDQYRPKIYLSPVHADPNINNQYHHGITKEFFSEIDRKFIRHGAKQKLNFSSKPTAISNACSADHIYSYMVGPSGELYNCWEDFGNAQLTLGTIDKGRIHNLDYLQKYHSFDPTAHSKCSNCTVMPLCMGGCPKKRLQHGEPQCGIYKYDLKTHVLSAFNK